MLFKYVGPTGLFFTHGKRYEVSDIEDDNGNIYKFKTETDVHEKVAIKESELKFWKLEQTKLKDDFSDNVNSPNHYTTGGIEVIDIIKAKMSDEQYKGYLLGNVIKYTLRHDKKGGKEDMQKADWYLNKLIEVMK